MQGRFSRSEITFIGFALLAIMGGVAFEIATALGWLPS